MTKKRLAIQLFGHLRTFRDTYESFFTNVVLPQKQAGYEVDIFVHTWDEIDFKTHKPVSVEERIFVQRVYEPKDILIEPQLKTDNPEIWHHTHDCGISYDQLFNQYYTMFKCNELREKFEAAKGIHYDYVLATRPDIRFESKIKIDPLIERFDAYYGKRNDKSKVLFTSASQYYDSEQNIGVPFINVDFLGCLDVIMLSNPNLMSKAQGLFQKFDTMIEKFGFYNHETFIKSYWKSLLINVLPINYIEGRDFVIVREAPEPNVKQGKKVNIARRFLACLIPFKHLRRKVRG